MHPAFSVIFFSTLTGAGYGLIAWSALALAAGWRTALEGRTTAVFLVALVLATVLVTVGLLSSLGHLGRPARAWRAFSQWRTSWLSREGVAAVFTFMPLVVLLATLSSAWWPAPLDGEAFAPGAALPWFARLSLAGAFLGAVATVACTAMIYASLKPIPAWRHRAVLPVYAGFALLTGGLLLATLLAAGGDRPALVEAGALVGLLLAVALAGGKRRYWRDIDRGAMPASRASRSACRPIASRRCSSARTRKPTTSRRRWASSSRAATPVGCARWPSRCSASCRLSCARVCWSPGARPRRCCWRWRRSPPCSARSSSAGCSSPRRSTS